MDLQISPRDIDRTYRIGVPNRGKNRPIIIKFVQFNDRGKYSIKRKDWKKTWQSTSLRKIRMWELNEAKNKFRLRNA